MAQRNGASQSNRLWTVDFILNLLTAHFMFAGYTAMLTVIPPYVLFRHGTEWHLGIIVGAFGIVGLLIRPFGGQWIYAFGPKRVAVAGTAIVAIGSLCYIFALSPWWLVPMRMLQGVGLALGPVATSTIVANLAPPTRRAEAMAHMGNAINASFLYSPFIASSILFYFGSNTIGFTYAFVFSALAAAVAMISGLRISASRIAFDKPAAPTANTAVRYRVRRGSSRNFDEPAASAASAAADKPPLVAKAAIFPTLVFLTYTFTTAPTNTFLPLLAAQQKLGNPGLFYTVFSATSIVAMGVSGPIADRYGRSTVIIPGLLSVAVAMFVLNGAFFQAMFLSAGFFAGLGFGLLQPGIQSLTVDRVPLRERSAGMATLQQAWDIGGSAGSFVVGPLATPIGIANVFGVTGIGALLGALGFVIGNAKSPAALPGRASAGD